MKNGFLPIAAGLLLLVFFSGCNGPKPQNKPAYFELLLEQEPCTEQTCFKEFIVASDGTFFAKTSHRNDGLSTPVFFFGTLSKEQTDSLFAFTREKFSVSAFEPCVTCYRLYFLDGQKLVRIEENAQNQKPALKELFETVSQLQAVSSPAERAYLKIVFKEQGKPPADYHYFPSGLVVKAVFGAANEGLSEAALESMPEKIVEIKNRLTPAFFSTPTELNCLPNLVYGYLEAVLDSRYASHWVCGAGGTEADALFAKLYGEKQ